MIIYFYTILNLSTISNLQSLFRSVQFIYLSYSFSLQCHPPTNCSVSLRHMRRDIVTVVVDMNECPVYNRNTLEEIRQDLAKEGVLVRGTHSTESKSSRNGILP